MKEVGFPVDDPRYQSVHQAKCQIQALALELFERLKV